jgi:hypothetical protein
MAANGKTNPFAPVEFVNDDMEIIAGAFHSAFKTVMDQYLDEGQRDKLNQWVTTIAVEGKPWMWTSGDGQALLLDLVMVDEFYRDFVMALTFLFFARWGEAGVKFTGLVDTLSWGTAADTPESEEMDLVLMPRVIRDRLVSQTDVKKYLAANKWVVTLMLIKLFVVPGVTSGNTTKPVSTS